MAQLIFSHTILPGGQILKLYLIPLEDIKLLFYYSATVNDLQVKVESLTTTNALMKEDLSITRTCVDKIQVRNTSTAEALVNTSLTSIDNLKRPQVAAR